MDSSEYYCELPHKSTLSSKLLWAIHTDTTPWSSLYDFNAKLVPKEWLMEDPFMAKLMELHSFQAAVIGMDAETCYRWHIDVDRSASVNMLLTPESHSYCVFKEDVDTRTHPILRLDYKPDTYYLLNVKKYHTVFNFDKPRYMLSTQFDDINLTYDDIKSELLNITI